jgi:pimeloyl-ACP methyl ester carboxylesterase
MDALNIPSAHFLGHSMGGAIVQQLCIDHPDKVKKALICASAAQFPAATKLQIQTNEKLFQLGTPIETLILSVFPWLYSDAFLSDPDNVKQTLHEMLHEPYPQTPAGYAGQIQAILDHDVRDRLHKIQARTWIVAGEYDLYTPLYCAEYLRKHIPNSEVKIIRNQAHLFNMERPEELIYLIEQFLG